MSKKNQWLAWTPALNRAIKDGYVEEFHAAAREVREAVRMDSLSRYQAAVKKLTSFPLVGQSVVDAIVEAGTTINSPVLGAHTSPSPLPEWESSEGKDTFIQTR